MQEIVSGSFIFGISKVYLVCGIPEICVHNVSDIHSQAVEPFDFNESEHIKKGIFFSFEKKLKAIF